MENKIMISEYKNVRDSKPTKERSIISFLKAIKDGEWQDIVIQTQVALQKCTTKKERGEVKSKCPGFRLSGSFTGQSDNSLRAHSGFIAIDIDNVENPNTVKEILSKDNYVYASFYSISGQGLVAVFRIDGSRHEDAFNAISHYLYQNYQLITDQSCKNVSRFRFVSFDPFLYINEDAPVFKKYLPKPKVQKIQKVVFVQNDFDSIVKQLYDRGINFCEDYSTWLATCFAIVSKFGDTYEGRNYFDILSSMSSKYNAKDCQRQYDTCLTAHSDNKNKVSTIGMIYHVAKQNGIEVYSEDTKETMRTTASQHKSGVSQQDIAKGLKKYNDIAEEYSLPIIQQVIEQGIEHKSENVIDDIISFLRPYDLKKNVITRAVERDGKPLDDNDINTLFIDCKSVFDKASKDLVCSVIYSNKTEQYNPLKTFFESGSSTVENTPNLNILLDSIITDTGDYKKWVTKWLVSVVASSYGDYSPLVLVFSGQKQGTGKTYWFRYLLPKQLRSLFGESKMDNGKDDEILMTKKLIILDDEYGGKSKREEKKLKEITAKEFINVREPYGRVSVDLRRISVFCGTSNDNQILSDPTGNRRILPINIIDIDHDKYNSCNKIDLWHELYALYKSGYDYTVLKEDIAQLNINTEMFTMSSPEEDLIAEKLKPASNGLGEWMNITSIIAYLTGSNTSFRLSNVRVGMVLSNIGFQKKRVKLNGSSVNVFYVQKLKEDDFSNKTDDAPF